MTTFYFAAQLMNMIYLIKYLTVLSCDEGKAGNFFSICYFNFLCIQDREVCTIKSNNINCINAILNE